MGGTVGMTHVWRSKVILQDLSFGGRHLYLLSHVAPVSPTTPLYFLRQGLSLYLVLGDLTILADQYAPGILLRYHRDYRCFYMGPGN